MPEIEISSWEVLQKDKMEKRYILSTTREEWVMKLEEFKLLAIDILKVLEKEGQDIPALVKYAHDHLDEFRFR
jgi:hypothetical protein